MVQGVEYTIATELVNKLRYFDGDCALCELCNHRHNCDSDGLFGCKTGIAEWIFKIVRAAEKPKEEELTDEQRKRKAYYQAHKEECIARTKAYIDKNKEKHKEYNRQYYLTHKEERKKKSQQWREDHLEQIKESNKKWRDEHPGYRGNKTTEEIKEYHRQYYQANKEKFREWAKARRERLASGDECNERATWREKQN